MVKSHYPDGSFNSPIFSILTHYFTYPYLSLQLSEGLCSIMLSKGESHHSQDRKSFITKLLASIRKLQMEGSSMCHQKAASEPIRYLIVNGSLMIPRMGSEGR
jgi:hypothetical protein